MKELLSVANEAGRRECALLSLEYPLNVYQRALQQTVAPATLDLPLVVHPSVWTCATGGTVIADVIS